MSLIIQNATTVLGTLVGALIVYGCKLKGKINALIVAINTLIIIPILLIFLLHCPQQEVVGITTPYTNDGSVVYNCHTAYNLYTELK